MITLAFDTCLDKMYVALGDNDTIFDSKIVETTKEHYHSAFLISAIKEILIKNNLTPKDIEVIATNIGPGSFTGIRACTTVARVFAQSNNIKTAGVSSLEILSRIRKQENKDAKTQRGKEAKEDENYASFHPGIFASENRSTLQPFNPSTLVALDARKEMAYVAIFEEDKQFLEPQSMLIEDLKELIAKNNYFIVTDDKLEPILGGISYQKTNADLGKCLIEITNKKIEENCETDWRKLHPLYIQPPAVMVKSEK